MAITPFDALEIRKLWKQYVFMLSAYAPLCRVQKNCVGHFTYPHRRDWYPCTQNKQKPTHCVSVSTYPLCTFENYQFSDTGISLTQLCYVTIFSFYVLSIRI
jgi:hypothetical protein